MGCLVELFLSRQTKKQNKDFPNSKIVHHVLTVTRSQQPIYMAGSMAPMTYARGKSEMILRLDLVGLTDGEFQDLFKKIDKGDVLGPIRIEIENNMLEVFGVATKVNYEGRRWENLIELEVMVEHVISQVGGVHRELSRQTVQRESRADDQTLHQRAV